MPVQFSAIGKKTKDLFKKQYDYKNEFKVCVKPAGYKIESAGVLGGKLTGSTKVNWKDATFGDLEVEVHSGGSIKGKCEKKKIIPGVDLTVTGAASTDVSVEAAYAQNSVAGTVKTAYNIASGAAKVDASGAISYDKVSIGGSVVVDPVAGVPKDYNFGCMYAAKDLEAAVVTSNKASDITLSTYTKGMKNLLVGTSVTVKSTGSSSFGFGGEFAFDKNTVLKAKVDDSCTLGTAISHTFMDNALKFCVSAQFGLKGDKAPQKLGMSLTVL